MTEDACLIISPLRPIVLILSVSASAGGGRDAQRRIGKHHGIIGEG